VSFGIHGMLVQRDRQLDQEICEVARQGRASRRRPNQATREAQSKITKTPRSLLRALLSVLLDV